MSTEKSAVNTSGNTLLNSFSTNATKPTTKSKHDDGDEEEVGVIRRSKRIRKSRIDSDPDFVAEDDNDDNEPDNKQRKKV